MKDGKFVILCVDDDPDILETLRLVLEKNNYAMVAASSAQEALEKARTAAPDFFVVDMMMEQVDSGTALVAKLRAEGNQAPMYMLSAVGNGLERSVDTSTLGLDGVFQKPIDPRALLATIQARLKR